jgi:hypothetical protein
MVAVVNQVNQIISGNQGGSTPPSSISATSTRLARLWEARVLVPLCMGNAVGWAGQVRRPVQLGSAQPTVHTMPSACYKLQREKTAEDERLRS